MNFSEICLALRSDSRTISILSAEFCGYEFRVWSTVSAISVKPIRRPKNAATATSFAALSTAGIIPPALTA